MSYATGRDLYWQFITTKSNNRFQFTEIPKVMARQGLRDCHPSNEPFSKKWIYPNLPRNSALHCEQSRIWKPTQEFPHINDQIDYNKSSYTNASFSSPQLRIKLPSQNLSTLLKLWTNVETSTSPFVPDPRSSKLFTINRMSISDHGDVITFFISCNTNSDDIRYQINDTSTIASLTHGNKNRRVENNLKTRDMGIVINTITRRSKDLFLISKKTETTPPSFIITYAFHFHTCQYQPIPVSCFTSLHAPCLALPTSSLHIRNYNLNPIKVRSEKEKEVHR